MPDRTYNVIYTSNNADILAKTLQVDAALRSLDALVTTLTPKLRGYASGSGNSVGAAARAAQNLAAQLNAISSNAAAAQAALGGIAAPAAQVAPAIAAGTVQVGKFTEAMHGLGIAKQVLGPVLAVSEEIEERWRKMAEEAAKFRDSLRELSNIRGEEGPNNRVYADVLRLAQETDSTTEQAREAAESYENIGPTIRQKGHYRPGGKDPKDATEAEIAALEQSVLIEAVRTGRRFGLDEGTAGEAIGNVGMFHGIESPESAMNQMGMALSGLSEGKLAYTKGVVALNKAAAKLVDPNEAAGEGAKPGRIQSYGEAGIYLGALSLGTGTADQASHRMVQISRTLNPTDPAKREVLAAAGITDQMDDAAKLIRLSEFVREQKIEDPLNWLAQNQIGSEATREATVAGMKVADVLKTRLDDARKRAKGGGIGREVIAENAKARARQQGSINAQQRSTEDVLNKVEGLAAEPLEVAKQYAEQRMRLYDPYYRDVIGNVLKQATSIVSYPLTGVGGTGSHQEQHETMGAIPTLRREAKKVGIDVDKEFPDINAFNYQTRSEAFGAASRAVLERGGDPFGRKGVERGIRERINAIPGSGQATGQPGGPVSSTGVGAGASDPVQVAQLEELKRIRDALASNGGGFGGPLGPIGPSPLPGGAVRAGES